MCSGHHASLKCAVLSCACSVQERPLAGVHWLPLATRAAALAVQAPGVQGYWGAAAANLYFLHQLLHLEVKDDALAVITAVKVEPDLLGEG